MMPKSVDWMAHQCAQHHHVQADEHLEHFMIYIAPRAAARHRGSFLATLAANTRYVAVLKKCPAASQGERRSRLWRLRDQVLLYQSGEVDPSASFSKNLFGRKVLGPPLCLTPTATARLSVEVHMPYVSHAVGGRKALLPLWCSGYLAM